MFKYQFGLLFYLNVKPQVLSTECDCRNLLLTFIVCCVDNTYGMVKKSQTVCGPASYRISDTLIHQHSSCY